MNFFHVFSESLHSDRSLRQYTFDESVVNDIIDLYESPVR